MACRECGRALDKDARFCPDCGSATGGVCGSCGLPLDADARFCKQCGTPVAGDRASRVVDEIRERKVATLLFADLADFTAMGEAHDPEVVSALVGQALERLAREVRRYEGTIEKFAGDALLAVFGVPATHEDDPERAVRAALEMQAAIADRNAASGGVPQLKLRIGIESGEILVDRSRASAERDLFVTGDAVNTAARLESAAEPGTVVVGPATYGATQHIVDYKALPPLALKGKAKPVVAWQAVAVRTGRGGRRAPLGLQAPLVGRDTELAQIKDAVAEAVDTERPHLVTVIGSAGVGKSRLAWELEKYVDGLPQTYHWRKGRCLPYAGASFGPIADIAKADARISDDDPPARAHEKLEARLGQLPLDDQEPSVRDALEAVLGIGARRERSRGELFEAWRHYLEAIARLHPLVLVVEDIHWADDATLSFLDVVARWADGPIALVCLGRHELLEVRAGWGAGLPDARTIALEPLEDAASARLVEDLLGDGVPSAAQRSIVELAEGNPLFAEELVRMLVDQGTLRSSNGAWHLTRPIEEVEVPGTIQAVIAARLDTLSAGEKRVAQHAAVIGRVFWDRLVARLTGADLDAVGEHLRGLRVKDVVIGREPSALAGAAEYGFRHVLVRDVAYESLPKRERSRLHWDVATWAESSLEDRGGEQTELIASHLLAAVELVREFKHDGAELRALRALAYPAALRAARRAASLVQVAHACEWMRIAVELAGQQGEGARTIARLVDEDVRTHGYLNEDARHVNLLASAVDGLAGAAPLERDDTALLTRLRTALAQTQFAAQDEEGAIATLQRGLAALDEEAPSADRARLLAELGHIHWRAERAEEAVSVLELAMAEARAADDPVPLRWAMHDLSVAYAFLLPTDIDRSVELVEESYQLAVAAGDQPLLYRCRNNLPVIHYDRGDALAALVAMTEETVRDERRAGVSVTYSAGNLAHYLLEMGRLDEALAYAQEAAASEVLHGLRTGAGVFEAWLHLLRGDADGPERARVYARAAETITEPQLMTQLLRIRAAAHWTQDREGALAELTAAIDERDRRFGVIWLDMVHEAARMALRLRDRKRLEETIALHQRTRWPGGPALDARYRWIDGLTADDDGAAVEKAAEDLARVDYVRKAMDAWTDAALMAARAGRPSDAQERAQALADATGMHSLLGLPGESEPRSRTAQ